MIGVFNCHKIQVLINHCFSFVQLPSGGFMSGDLKFWSQIKQNLQKKPGNRILKSVLNSVQTEGRDFQGGKKLILSVPSTFHQNVLKAFLPEIKKQVENEGFLKVFVEKKDLHPPLPPVPSKVLFPPQKKPVSAKKRAFSPFKEFTFDSFIPGQNNHFAWAAAKNQALCPQKIKSNPILFHSATGLGKTHLLLAIRNHIQKNHPHLKICYLSAERFLNEYISHIQKKQMPLFRSKYRDRFQVFLVDDSQILSRGHSVQDEFFFTFEHLIQNNCQIILACDQHPGELEGLKSRLRTRFAGGLTISLQVPDTETKIAIMKHKIKTSASHPPLSEDILSYLAHICRQSSVRELLGCLKTIKMFCELQNTRPTFPLIQKLFPSEPVPVSPALKITHLKKVVGEVFHLNPRDLSSKSRIKNLVQARHIACFLAKELTSFSTPEIGRFFGGKDHSSVLYATKKIRRQLKTDKELALAVKKIRGQLLLWKKPESSPEPSPQ